MVSQKMRQMLRMLFSRFLELSKPKMKISVVMVLGDLLIYLLVKR